MKKYKNYLIKARGINMRWFAWDMEKLIVKIKDNLQYTIIFNTKSEAIWEISCSYMDGRKKPTVKRMNKGCYIYSPKDCDGNWRDENTIVNEKYLKENKSLKEYFLKHLNNLLDNIKEDMENVTEERKTQPYYKDLETFKKECEMIKEDFI